MTPSPDPARPASYEEDTMSADPDVLRNLAVLIEDVIAEKDKGIVSKGSILTTLGCLVVNNQEAILSALRAQNEGAAAMPVIEFHQQDWIPGFAAFLPGATTPQPNSRAFCVLNLGSLLSTVANGDVPAADLPAFIVESMIHEVGHVLEQWAGVEFSEERVEALCDRYRAAVNAEAPLPPPPPARNTPEGGEDGR